MLTLKKIRWLAVGLVVSGCTGTTNLSSELVGMCLKTNIVSYVYASQCPAASGKYLISTREDSTPQCLPESITFKLEVGTEMDIHHVIRQGRGATGNCLRIEAGILSGEQRGLLADLPVCGIAHPRPFWITQGFDAESEIIFNKDYVSLVPCSE